VSPTRDEAGERAMFEAFLAWYDEQEDPLLYAWSPYEKTHLRRLAQRHGIAPEREARVFGRLRDLLRDAEASFAFPTYGTSIKKIAPWIGFRWRHADVNAMASIALYFDYCSDPARKADKLQKVLDYNEDDCIAMRVVKDWLVAQN
jgi:predicted RecB family nuclease